LKDRVIVLNFWLLACKPCIMEIPELNKLVEKYNGDNICFIAPTMNTTEEELVNQILSKQPFSYNIVIGDSNDYEISAFPTHVVLNKKHEVVEIITGYSKENIQKLDITIENCLRK